MTEWISAIAAGISILGAFAVVLWRIGMVIDRNTVAVSSLMKVIEKHEYKIDLHDGKIVALETWREIHEAHHG